MAEEAKTSENLSADIQEAMRSLIAAIRAVKLYPQNNPIYAQSIRKAFESIDSCLQTSPRFPVGVQKTFFVYGDIPVGKELQQNRAIAQDIFAKGIREIVFLAGISEEELLDLLRALALAPEEIAMRSGLASILWEKNATHIKVVEAALEEVVIAAAGGTKRSVVEEEHPIQLDPSSAKKEFLFKGRTLVLGDIAADPKGFADVMLDIARTTVGKDETIEDRLHTLYQEAGRQIESNHPEESEALFQGLARAVLATDQTIRDKFIAGKLYAGLDGESVRDLKEQFQEQIPNDLHEIMTGRFARDWTVKQVAVLLRKVVRKKDESSVFPDTLDSHVAPLPPDIVFLAKDLAEYTPDEMETLKQVGEMGMESDIIEASVRTLIFLLSMALHPYQADDVDKEEKLFSGVVHQLEDTLGYLLKKKDYVLASLIVRSYHIPVDERFRPRLAEAIKKASSREIIAGVLSDMRNNAKNSDRYEEAYSYLLLLDREATPILLEILAEEQDRTIRRYLLDLLKELGKNQIEMLGQRLTDERWYLVRNIVNILGESKNDKALVLLEKVTDHKNVQIRHEVIKGLISIGGRKAAAMLVRFLKDKEQEIQTAAIRGLGAVSGAGMDEIRALIGFLGGRSVNKKDQDILVEGFKTLARIGDGQAKEFLKRYLRIRWWKPRRIQEKVRVAALSAISEIERRESNAGSAR